MLYMYGTSSLEHTVKVIYIQTVVVWDCLTINSICNKNPTAHSVNPGLPIQKSLDNGDKFCCLTLSLTIRVAFLGWTSWHFCEKPWWKNSKISKLGNKPRDIGIICSYIYISHILSMHGIFTHIWLKFMVNVGKYSSPMEHLGIIYIYIYDIFTSKPNQLRVKLHLQFLLVSRLGNRNPCVASRSRPIGFYTSFTATLGTLRSLYMEITRVAMSERPLIHGPWVTGVFSPQ